MYVAMLGVMENRKHLLSPGSDRAKARVTASEPDTKNYKHRQVAYQNAATKSLCKLRSGVECNLGKQRAGPKHHTKQVLWMPRDPDGEAEGSRIGDLQRCLRSVQKLWRKWGSSARS